MILAIVYFVSNFVFDKTMKKSNDSIHQMVFTKYLVKERDGVTVRVMGVRMLIQLNHVWKEMTANKFSVLRKI